MKLSIIIPYYNVLDHIKRLFKVLEPQLDDEVEVLIIDDGCNEKELDKLKAKVIHLEKNSGGAGKPRNIGIENSTGEYIAFIDADDMITDNYIKEIKNKIKEQNDIIYLSWRSSKHNVIVKDKPPFWNPTVWSNVYKRDLIGDKRFREDISYGEDKYFNKKIKPKTSSAVEKQIYIYNSNRCKSLSKVGVRKIYKIIIIIGIAQIITTILLIYVLWKLNVFNML